MKEAGYIAGRMVASVLLSHITNKISFTFGGNKLFQSVTTFLCTHLTD
jgi:hypothetical protein